MCIYCVLGCCYGRLPWSKLHICELLFVNCYFLLSGWRFGPAMTQFYNHKETQTIGQKWNRE